MRSGVPLGRKKMPLRFSAGFCLICHRGTMAILVALCTSLCWKEPLNDECSSPQWYALLGKESLMLVLTRHAGEKIILPGLGITIQVLAIKRGGVRIGADTPPEIPVLREEIADARRSCALPLGHDPARGLSLACAMPVA